MKTTASTTSKQARNRKRARNRVRLFLALCAGSFVMLVAILLLLPSFLGGLHSEEKPSALGVTAIAVEGNTRYDEDAVIAVSGIKKGQSVFSVDRRKAANKLKKEFYFFEEVTVKIDLARRVTIRVTEAEVMGAVYAEGQWVLVSHKGIGLQASPVTTERPLRQLYIKGAGVLTAELGKPVLDEESSEIVAEIFEAAKAVQLDNLTLVDIENRNDIKLNWNNQITILLGNSSNLRHEIAVAASALPVIFDKHGKTVTGQLNLKQYSNPDVAEPAIVFTPSEVLNDTKK
ncbi:MAG: FtsQ-type POTRA domain-containing protein [Clostridia bacterium]|nr:FtsQ-type POTRA domain-containing protein [Clostridia bacterium]